MKISLSWLKELVDYNLSPEELEQLISLHTYPTKELTENYLELDLKGYNRPDLLSMRGVATEIGAITASMIKFQDQFPNFDQNLSKTPVKVSQQELSPLQCVAKIEGLKVEKSSDLWIERLTACGMRPVNNIADVTNLVMLEFGQPLHSFDASTIQDDTIIVRLATQGEEIITLDGKLRKLTKQDIVLADEEKALDVAGVMGGKATEITEATTTILLSASLFSPEMVRKTSGRLKLQSEASRRFYHGLTRRRLLQAFQVAIRMYEDLGGKLVALTIVGDTVDPIKKISLSYEKVNSLIGVEIQREQVAEFLTKLHFRLTQNNDGWEVEVPYFRLDIEVEEDLIEEVARMYGYDNIPANKLPGNPPPAIDQSSFELIINLKESLVSSGLTEVQTYSFFSERTLNILHPINSRLIKLANPISSETAYLKFSLWPNLVEVAAKNLKQGIDEILIFEIGKNYWIDSQKNTQENYHLSILIVNNSQSPVQELYEIIKKINLLKGFKPTVNDEENIFFHPARLWNLQDIDMCVGFVGEVHPRILHKYGIDNRVAVLEIELKV